MSLICQLDLAKPQCVCVRGTDLNVTIHVIVISYRYWFKTKEANHLRVVYT